MSNSSFSSRVSLVKGEDRYSNVRKALELVSDDIRLDKVKRVLIKPNLSSVTRQLAATHVDAVRALLDFLRQRTSAQIIIAESCGEATTTIGFRNFGYQPLAEQYKVRLLDLNDDKPIRTQIFNSQLRPLTVRLSKTAVEADFRISICPPKTHDFVIFTACLKNLAMGSVIQRRRLIISQLFELGKKLRGSSSVPFSGWVATQAANILGNDKIKVHQGYPAMNLNLYKLARLVFPHLSVIDGFEAMEGDGPADGERVELGVALASTDPVACDSVAAKLAGFDIDQIGYLTYCYHGSLGQGNLSQIEIVGDRLESCTRVFKPHHTYEMQLQWHIPHPERFLD